MTTDFHPTADPLSPAERAKKLIDTGHNKSLSLRRLAAEANLSPYHFIRSFRSTFYTTPHQYLIRKRIEHAKRLLSETQIPVTEVCYEVGFESLGSFSHLFRKIVGWAPTIYRARCAEQRREPRSFIPECFWIMHHLGGSPSSTPSQ